MPFVAMAAMPQTEEKLRAGTLIRGMGAVDAQAQAKAWQAAYTDALSKGYSMVQATSMANEKAALASTPAPSGSGGGAFKAFTDALTALSMTAKTGAEVAAAFRKPATPVPVTPPIPQPRVDNTTKYLGYGLIGVGVVALGAAGYLALTKPKKAKATAAATASNPRRRRRRR